MEIDIEAWRDAVAKHLEGRDKVLTGSVALHALGPKYQDMDVPGWRAFASVMQALGWRRRKFDGGRYWEAPADV